MKGLLFYQRNVAGAKDNEKSVNPDIADRIGDCEWNPKLGV